MVYSRLPWLALFCSINFPSLFTFLRCCNLSIGKPFILYSFDYNMNLAQVRDIVNKLKQVSAKDPTSLSIVINGLPNDQRMELLTTLNSIERESQEKTIKESNRTDNTERKKAEEKERFLGKLKAKLSEITDNNESVVLKTNFDNANELLCYDLSPDTHVLLAEFQQLTKFVADLDALKCLARFKQGRILQHIMDTEKLSIANVAAKLKIIPSFAERLTNFATFTQTFPALLASGYSFNTILKYKKFIENAAEEDENFKSLLEINININFDAVEDMEDDDGNTSVIM